MLQNTALLVSSCDKYSDCWDPFFKLLSIYWKDLEYPVYLITEEKEYECPYMPVTALKIGGGVHLVAVS